MKKDMDKVEVKAEEVKAEVSEDTILDFIDGCGDLAIIRKIQAACVAKGKALLEAKKETAKEEKAALAAVGESLKDKVKVGSTVRFLYGSGKNQEVLEAKVVKFGDGKKTFHVQIEGKEKTTWRYFSQLVAVIEDAEDVAKAE
jgi:hypothetical protein